MAIEPIELVDAENPWPGILPFSEEMRVFFHGRTTEIAELVRRVRRETLTVLFGPPGIGKTSLLKAGLFPSLRDSHLLPIYFRLRFSTPAPSLIDQIKHVIHKEFKIYGIDTRRLQDDATLWGYFHTRDHEFLKIMPVLVFDQFEEIFTRGRDIDSRADFIDEISALIEGRAPERLRREIEADPELVRGYDFDRENYKLVIVIREEFLPQLESLQFQLPSVMFNRMPLARMTRLGARDVILRSGNKLVADDVADQILDIVAASSSEVAPRTLGDGDATGLEIEPAPLSIFCRELNQERRRRGLARITSDLVGSGHQEILTEFYKTSIADVGQPLKLFIEDQLVTAEGHRRSCRLSEALSYAGMTSELIQLLGCRGVLIIEERFGVEWVELANELLVDVVRRQRELRGIEEAQARAEAARERAERAEKAEWHRSVVLNAREALRANKAEVAELIALVALSEEIGGSGKLPSPSAISAVNCLAEARSRDRQRALLLGHGAEVNSADFSPDGKRIVTASADRTARVWGAPTGVPLAVLDGHTSFVNSAIFSPDGKWIATASADNTARLWDAATGAKHVVLLGHSSYVNSAVFSPDGGRVLTASADHTARLWDAVTGTELAVFEHSDIINTATFSPDGTRIVISSSDRTSRLLDATMRTQIAVLGRHGSFVASATFSLDGARTVTASADQTAQVWDAATGRQIIVLEGHTNDVTAAAFSRDGAQIVTASRDLTSRVWDATTGQELFALLEHSGAVTGAAFSPDRRFVVTASADRTARIWDARLSEELLSLEGHTGYVNGAAFSPDGRHIVTASFDQTARLWDAATGAPSVDFKGHAAEVRSVAFSPDGTRVVTASADHTARIWQATSGAPVALLAGHKSFVNSATFGPDGLRVATASADYDVGLWDAERGNQLGVLKGHTSFVNSASFSADGARIATASADHTARLWDANTGLLLLVLNGHTSFVNTAEFSPDGTRVVTASADHIGRIWDAATGAQIAVLPGQWRGAFSPDGRRVLTASAEDTAGIWDAETGALVAVVRGHSAAITSVAFSADGSRIVTAARDNTARVWEVWPFLTADTVSFAAISAFRTLSDAERSSFVPATLSPEVPSVGGSNQGRNQQNGAAWHQNLAVQCELGDQEPRNLKQALFHYAIAASLFEAAGDEKNAVIARARRGSVARSIDPCEAVEVAKQVAAWRPKTDSRHSRTS